MSENFEIVEFYPSEPELAQKNHKVIGSLHIYVIDCQMDIRGILVIKTKKGIFFHMPHGSNYDYDEKRVVHFPVINFTQEGKMEAMKNFVQTEGRKYISRKLTEIENLNKKQVKATLSPDKKYNATKSLKTT